MVIAYALFDLHLPGCRGLKEKRMIVKSLKSRIRNEFEISAAEVGDQDLLQRSLLGVAVIGPDQQPLDACFRTYSGSSNNLAGEPRLRNGSSMSDRAGSRLTPHA
jgi:uncharacterized protein YlxP (DUF503 family)